MRMLDLFAGICGVSLAAEWAGIETVAFCEIEPFPQKIIQKHWPGVPIFEDVRKLNRQMLIDKGVIDDAGTRTIDIICAGYPCQPFSNAGQRRGEEDDRHLWPEVARLIKEIRPRWFVGENVAGHITLGLDNVLADLGGLSYSFETFVIPAAAIGAGHKRDRVFIVGNTEHYGHVTPTFGRSADQAGDHNKEGQNESGELTGASRSKDDEALADTSSAGLPECPQIRIAERDAETGTRVELQPERCSEVMADSNIARMEGSTNSGSDGSDRTKSRDEHTRRFGSDKSRGTIESGLGGVLDGLSGRLDEHRWPAGLGQPQHDWEPPRVATGVKNRVGRLKGLGNAVSPQQIYPVLYFIKQINDGLELSI